MVNWLLPPRLISSDNIIIIWKFNEIPGNCVNLLMPTPTRIASVDPSVF